MKINKAEEVPPDAVEGEGAEGVRIRWLIGKEDRAPNFYMRHFTVAAGGRTARHSHDWEHEVYILSGRGAVASAEGDKQVSAGDFVFVAPGEVHQFANTGDEELKFLCLVPKASI
ncbi:MAG: cupin domain-containing protein [Planctomycetota bacterium]|jgi:quercetin dioxygenase-like cupin family protein